MMLTTIAWRNVWRSPGRTITIIMAVAVGVASLSFLTGFINGFVINFVDNGIQSDYAHVQIHHPAFKADKELKYDIKNADEVAEKVKLLPGVVAVTERTLINGMISSPKTANGIQIYGIDVNLESQITNIDSSLVEGTYLSTIKKNPILISTEVAEKLRLKLRSKVVITVQNENREIVAGAFRVDGIFESRSKRINDGAVFVKQQDLARLIGGPVKIHEIAIMGTSHENAQILADSISQIAPELTTESWAQLAPELELMQSQVWINMLVVLVIIMGALCFGIVNTMLMAVLERVRELGMLMAIGMKKTRIFKMIVLETIMMALVGGPLGIIIGLLFNQYFIVNGLDLSAYSEGLKEFGYSNILYPTIQVMDYVVIAISVGVTAIIAAIYPARKATKLKPVEALHTI